MKIGLSKVSNDALFVVFLKEHGPAILAHLSYLHMVMSFSASVRFKGMNLSLFRVG